MASPSISFSDIKLILCVQGYSLDYQFILREIGFWTNNFSGSIPLNCKINKNQLDIKNQKTIFALEEDIHGIKTKKPIENGLALSEIKTVLKTLYNLSNNSNSKYIGICRDENINGLLHQAGLGKYVIEMDNLDIFRDSSKKCPSNTDLKIVLKAHPNKYRICGLHDLLRDGSLPLCAKVKTEYIADYCREIIKQNLSTPNNCNT